MGHSPAIYGQTLAQIHSDGYARTYWAGYGALCDQISGPKARLFDIGCGDGTWLSFAADRGIPGSGCDQSPAFVQTAQSHGCDVVLATGANANIPEDTTAVTALGEVLCYHKQGYPPDLDDVLAMVANMPTVTFLAFDLIGPTVKPRSVSSAEGAARMSFHTRIEGSTMIREIETVLDGHTDIEIHYQRIMDPQDVKEQVERSGFSCTIATHYGPCPLLPGRFAVLAQRKG